MFYTPLQDISTFFIILRRRKEDSRRFNPVWNQLISFHINKNWIRDLIASFLESKQSNITEHYDYWLCENIEIECIEFYGRFLQDEKL